MILLPPPPYCRAVTLHSAGTQQLANVNERFKNRPNIPRNGKKNPNKQKSFLFYLFQLQKYFHQALQGGIKVHETRQNEGRMEKTTIFFFHFKERSMSTWNYSTFRDFSGMCSESCDLT